MDATTKIAGKDVTFYDLEYGGTDRAILMGGRIFTTEEEKALLKYLRPKDVVYDVGTYIGTHAILFALNGARVIGFEPFHHNYFRAQKNCFPFLNIELFPVALNEKAYSCRTKFKDCNLETVGNAEQEISYVVLEDFIDANGLPYPDLVKMDIEGMESIVLKTFDGLFTFSRPVIFLEQHVAPRNSPTDYKDNPHWKYPDEGGFDFNTLKGHGYVIEDLKGNIKGSKEDWNPPVGSHDSVLLVPWEKYLPNS